MLILAFETSAKAGSVALLDGNRLLGEYYQNTAMTQSTTVMVMAESLIATCGHTPGDIQAVAVANGPGSFTGVRIGVAAAKGFAFGADIPCCGVSTLEAMAENLGVRDGYVVCVMDARRAQVYTAVFRACAGQLTRVTPDRAISLEQLGQEIKNIKESVFLVGDGSFLCYNTFKDTLPSLILPPEHRMMPRAAGVGLCAYRALCAGESADAGTLKPNYLRLSQAERERLAREQK